MDYIETCVKHGKMVAKELYPQLSGDDKGLIGFGMIPFPVVESCLNHYMDELDKQFIKDLEQVNVNVDRKQIQNSFEHGLSLGLMQEASDVGMMAV